MGDKNKKFILVALVLVSISLFVLAAVAPGAPSALKVNLNTTNYFDGDGTFSLNWTAGDVDTASYTIWTIVNGNPNSYLTAATNDSTTGYLFENTTNANYTFIVQRVNATAPTTNRLNSTNISIVVDTTAPTITIFNNTANGYQNSSAFKNATSYIYLNISATDTAITNATVGVGSWCFVDVNGTNQSIAVASGWCNSTTISLSGLADGNHTIKVYINDSANNLVKNNSLAVWVDSTNPVATATCSDAYSEEAFPCSCGGTDTGGTGINSSLTSEDTTSRDGIATPTTTGTFTYTCTVYDKVGNTNSDTAAYTIGGNPGNSGSPSGSSPSTTTWTQTYIVSDEDFEQGYTKELEVQKRVQVKVKGISHHVGVTAIIDSTITIEIASDPQTATLSIGDARKFDVNDDNFYDVLVTLNSIANDKADITVKSISEEVTEETAAEEQSKEDSANPPEEIPEEGFEMKLWMWIVIAVVVLGIFLGIVLYNKKQ